VAKKIAEQCGGYFIPLPSDKPFGLSELSKDTAEIMKETADVINAVAKSLDDGKVTKAEKNTSLMRSMSRSRRFCARGSA